jgi:signal transduction histidine kinase
LKNQRILSNWVIITTSLLVITVILWNTFLFFQKFKAEERSKMEIWSLAQTELNKSIDNNISLLTLEVLKNNSTTPMIKVNNKGEIEIKNIDNFNVQDSVEVFNMIERFKKENQPINIIFDGKIIDTLYYGNSEVLNKLKYYPLALIVVILLFIFLIYFYYKSSKIASLNMLWTGMAKETAHQIGTPLTSLMGWVEILKGNNIDSDHIMEIEKDINRLNTISERFNKIGSKPILIKTNISTATKEIIDYLKTRVSNRVSIKFDINKDYFSLINKSLYSWTIENLIKNSVDAVKGDGEILINIFKEGLNINITIEDNGIGINKSNFNKIFNPGYTTKKRGWGLGLSLSKRIIENYHDGKIFIKSSEKNIKTIIVIQLREE